MDEGAMDPSIEDLQYEVSELLERAYKMQDLVESKAFKNYNTAVALNAAIEEMDKEYEEERRRSRVYSVTSSDPDSFFSARSVVDLSNLEEEKQEHRGLALYEAALLELEHGCIPCRTLRTRVLKCHSDTEFLAKLYCIREAFREAFKDVAVRDFFVEYGQKMISKLFHKSDKDPEDFEREYKLLIDWVQDPNSLQIMEEELLPRGVRVISFYDVVIDFIMLDAFDDLANPPSSVVSVVNNRWLSNGFKESALSTAVWSVLKAKRQLLKCPKGFMAHFYAVSEHTSPILAWGFLGPESEGNLKQLCHVFKDAVLGFVQDIFSFDKVRYTTLDQLTDDITVLARNSITRTMEILSV